MGPMNENEFLAERFEEHRTHLRAVAYRMLGSLTEADDAVQDAWLRVSRAGTEGVENLGGWLTTIVARVALNMLQSRKSRREETYDDHLPDPIISNEDPENEAMLVDSVGLAMLVVLEALAPGERLAFVLHDMFAVPFADIASILDTTPAAARQLASRARRRVQGTTAPPEADLTRQREVVDAFLAASRDGDFEALVSVLDPDVVLRADAGAAMGGLQLVRGAAAVANRALTFARAAQRPHQPVLVNGSAGLITLSDGQAIGIMGFTIVDGRIREIDIFADPERVRQLNLTIG